MYVAQPFESAAFWISCSRLRLASSSSWSESIWSMPGRANSLNPSLSPKPWMAVVIDLDDSLKTAVSSVEWIRVSWSREISCCQGPPPHH